MVLRIGSGARGVVSMLVARMPVLAVVVAVGFASLLSCASAGAAGDANTASCGESEAFPGFRAFMADCRGYELVTPPYVAGAVPRGQNPDLRFMPLMTAGGEHLLGIVFGGFAGTENLEQNNGNYGAIYEFSRTSGGWSTEALDPPASEYPRAVLSVASADLSRTLWQADPSAHSGEEAPPVVYADEEVILRREAAGGGKGRFQVVGPLAAPGHELLQLEDYPARPAGVSSDLSHVLFRVGAQYKQLWPGDETRPGDVSLYEYVGIGEHEPVLVGVRNDGTVAEAASHEGRSHINEAAEMVSRCGIKLGSEGIATTDNAVSADGEVVYFTALACAGGPPVNELYARVEGRHTVDISEPTSGPTGDCEACTGREGEPKAAVFEGASEDGSKVFFLSEQALLPGAEGDSLYEYDFSATDEHERLTLVVPDATIVTTPSGDGAHVYFQSTAELPTGSNANGEGPQLGAENLYLYDTQTRHTAYVAQEPGPVDVTRDGQFAVFESSRHLTSDDSSAVAQLFEYDASTGLVVRVSRGQKSPAGSECPATETVEERFNCDGDTASNAPVMNEPATYSTSEQIKATSQLSVSKDGTVVFISGDALTPFAVPGGENVYEYRAGNVYLISPGDETGSDGRSGEQSRLKGIDESGMDVFFGSEDRLVPQDTDTQVSFYDAREGGGFPAPPEAGECVEDVCQGPLGTAPQQPGTPGSALAAGGGNLSPSVSTPVSVPVAKGKPVSRAQELAKALRACRSKPVRQRIVCERQARKRYAPAGQKGRR